MSWVPPRLDEPPLRDVGPLPGDDRGEPGRAPLSRRYVSALSLASLALFLLACALPALQVHYLTPSDTDTFFGWQLLFWGWMGPLELQFAWCANLALPIVAFLLLLRLWVPAALVAAAGLLIASDTFAMFFQPTYIPGTRIYLTMPLIGFYLWMASFAVLLARAVIGLAAERPIVVGAVSVHPES